MSASDLIRWGGLAAMAAGVVFIFYWLFALANPLSPFLRSMFVLAELLVLVGLIGFHALQKGRYGRIGRAGFYTAIVAILVHVLSLEGTFLGGGAFFGWLAWVGILGQLVGLALYGAATLQARVLPRWCGIAFIVVVPLALITELIAGSLQSVVFGLIWLALGYVLFSRSTAGRQPTRVR